MSEDKRIEDMAQTMKAAAIEEMKAELEAAGWDIQRHADGGAMAAAYFPKGSSRFIGADTLDEAILEAYAHYQRERRYEELQRSYAELEARLAKVERELEDLRGDGK
jgi:hypothetical protein